MNYARACRRSVVAGVAATALVPASADASVSEIAVEVEVSSELGTDLWQVTLDQGDIDPLTGTWHWRGEAIDLGSGSTAGLEGEVIATLTSLAVAINADQPQVNVFFSLEAGAEDTEVTIRSGLVSFPTLDPAMGLASAAMTLTDGNGDGAWLTGLGPGGGAYLAQIEGLVPDGSTFLEAIDGLTADPGTTSDISAGFPGTGAFGAIADPVSSMSAQFSFLMSGQDLASGSSTFVLQVIPLPAPLGLGLAGLAGVAVVRRRRRGSAAAA